MMPAIRPALSWSPPSVADTSCTSPASNVNGSAPYFRTFARSRASCWVKSPSIWALPPVIGPLLRPGADTTRPSRTMPNRFSGGCWAASRRVVSANLRPPDPLKSSVTIQPPVTAPGEFVLRAASALVTSVPSTSAGPRMYFSLPSSRQVTNGFFGSSPPVVRRSVRTLARSLQSSSANCFAMSAVTPPLESAGAVALGAGVVVAVGLGVDAARSARGTARPLVDALGDGDAAGALPDADGEGDGLGAGSEGTPPAAFRTGRKRSSAVC